MQFKIRTALLSCLLTGWIFQVWAQPVRQFVEVFVAPQKSDWTYKVNESVSFIVTVLRNGSPVDGVEVNYRIAPEMMDNGQKGTTLLKNGSAVIKADGSKVPCFLRCEATVKIDGKEYSSFGTAGFSPEKIEPTTQFPADFEKFWEDGKAELSKVPINPLMTLMPERCTPTVDVYHVSIDNIRGKIYGILCVPKKEGKYPAILQVPGAGIRPYGGDVPMAEKGLIIFQIGIHGIPVNLDPKVYVDLANGPLYNYPAINLDDRDNYYYRRVYLGCVRAVDFICSLDKFDGSNLAVNGGSQGGALSIVSSALDKRIKYLAAFYPALCDLTGYLHGRAGGWPHLFRNSFTNKPEKIETSKYYDVVNFARFVKIPGWYSWGFNDNTCPPTSTYAAYNVINAEKELHLFQETRHWSFPEQRDLCSNWLLMKLLK